MENYTLYNQQRVIEVLLNEGGEGGAHFLGLLWFPVLMSTITHDASLFSNFSAFVYSQLHKSRTR
eukprot:1718677-Amphidinium_carterae.1